MKTRTLRTALLLAMALLLAFAGCTAPSGPAPSGAGSSASAGSASAAPSAAGAEAASAKGRYVESATALPASIDYVMTCDEVSPGEFYLFAAGKESLTWEIWHSTDDMATWTQLTPSWLSQYTELFNPSAAAFGADGTVYLTTILYNAETEEMAYQFVKAHLDGGYQEQEVEALKDYITGLRLTDRGDLLADHYFSIHQVNPETGADTEYAVDTYSSLGVYEPYGDTLAALDKDKNIALFDMNTGKQTDTIPCNAGSDGSRIIARQADGEGWLYCDRGGLFRVTPDGAMNEELIAGTSCSLGAPYVTASRLFPRADGSFLILAGRQDSPYQALRYTFDPEAPRGAERELSVYSLEENSTIRAAISMHQTNHPQVQVNYTVGIPEGSGVTASDAMRTLSTMLLSGSGPDVLVLDGLPLESYAAQGALADLAPHLDSRLQSGQLLANIGEAYRRDGRLWAMPSRFVLPVIAGDSIGAVDSLGGYVEWLERQDNKRTGLTPEVVMEQFYSIVRPRWFPESGRFDQAAMEEDLALLKRYADTIEYKESDGYSSAINQASRWTGNGVGCMFTTMESMSDYSYLSSGLATTGGGQVRLFPQDAGGIFVPQSVLAVNASSQNQEDALAFLDTALGAEVQQMAFRDGLPVNRAALEANATAHAPGEGTGSFGSSDNRTGERWDLNVNWPPKADTDAMVAMLAQVRTPSDVNRVIRDLVLEEAAPFFAGKATLEETAEALSQKIGRYLQEGQ